MTLILFLSFAFIYYRRRRRNSDHAFDNATGSKVTSPDAQPYFQQKGELDGEENRRPELSAVETRCEMDSANNIQEIPKRDHEIESDDTARPGMPSLREQHELRGEESARELEATSIGQTRILSMARDSI